MSSTKVTGELRELVQSVKTPLGFFVVVLGLMELGLVPLALQLTGFSQLIATVAACLFPFVLIGTVAGIAVWKPEALRGRRPRPPQGLPHQNLEQVESLNGPSSELTSTTLPASNAASVGVRRDRIVIDVSSEEEFVNAIGSNRVIRLRAGEYDLGVVRSRHMEHIRWDREHDGYTLTIRRVERLSIIGAGHEVTRLVVHPQYAQVLALEDCREVEIKDLTLGHSPQGYCVGGVVRARRCEYLEVESCVLFGCGTEGLICCDVRMARIVRTTIRDCSYGILTLEGCADVQFVGCEFAQNREFHGMVVHGCNWVEFVDCTVIDNQCAGPLFDVVSSSAVRFLRGAIGDNKCLRLGEGVEFCDAEVVRNRLGLER